MKTCSKCKIKKELDEFHKRKSSKDGYGFVCKECRKEEKEYYNKNKESILEKIRNNRKVNKKYLETNKKYKDSNKEFVNELKREWDKSENGKKVKKEYYQKNKETIKKNVRDNREKNKDYYKSKDKEKRQTEAYKTSHNTYIREYISKNKHIYAWRTLLHNTLKRLNTTKSSSTIEMLGYSANDLKEYLENLFIEGMNWDNHGSWHIDHIKPVSKFDKDTDVSIVNALSNLQPLWSEENLSKYNKYN